MQTDQDQEISEAIEREQARLRNFVRGRVFDVEEVEDILQDVFYELVVWQAVGLMALSWILFGGLRGFGMMGPRRHRGLTPEDREHIRNRMEKWGPAAQG